ncbi:hypothetical protein [Ureibacillus sp. GCM10028918]|uniref:hypothetical protein n=1 Tax=Ureibacillus sp. GCM10028918 TaxID=3273429 RepID=UPI00360AAFC8
MNLSVETDGVERAAAVDGLNSIAAIEARYDGTEYNLGGRSYSAKLIDEDKDAVDDTKVSVVVPKDKLSKGSDKEVWLIDENADTDDKNVYLVEADKEIELETNNSGEVNFRLVGEESAFATPTVYYDNGDDKGELDTDDLQDTGERVVFDDAEFGASKAYIKDANGNTVTSLPAGKTGTVYYTSVDQNGNPYVDGSVAGKEASFIIKAEKGSVKVGNTTVGVDDSETFKPTFNEAGVASVKITAEDDAEVSIKLSSKDPKIASKSLSLEFDGSLLTVPDSHTDWLTASGHIDTDENTITFAGYREIEYSTSNIKDERSGSLEPLTSSQFESLITTGLAGTTDYKIKAVKNEDGKYTLTIKDEDTNGIDVADPVVTPPASNTAPVAKTGLDTNVTATSATNELVLTANQLATDVDALDTLTIKGAISSNTTVATVAATTTGITVDAKATGSSTITVVVTDGKEDINVTFKVDVSTGAVSAVSQTVAYVPTSDATSAKYTSGAITSTLAGTAEIVLDIDDAYTTPVGETISLAGLSTAQQVADAINAEFPGVATVSGDQVVLTSTTDGISSEIDITSVTAAPFVVTTVNGVNAVTTATKAQFAFTVVASPVVGEEIQIGNETFTVVSGTPANDFEVQYDATPATFATNLKNAIAADSTVYNATVSTATITLEQRTASADSAPVVKVTK